MILDRDDMRVYLKQLQEGEERDRKDYDTGRTFFPQKPDLLFEVVLDYCFSKKLYDYGGELTLGYIALNILRENCLVTPMLFEKFRHKGYWKEAGELLLEHIFDSVLVYGENECRKACEINQVQIGTTTITKEEFIQKYYKDDIYVVMYAYYSDWTIYGYFTEKSEAEKYCLAHPEMELDVETLHCLDHRQDLSKLRVAYRHTVSFRQCNKTWFADPESNANNICKTINADQKENRYRIRVLDRNDCWDAKIEITIVSDRDDRAAAVKTAQDLLYQYLDFCGNHPDRESTAEFSNLNKR